ncbi:hypothetical protein NKDENANG_00568 [Candidatus Entotheonellaceae bacterium PAL068K]
MLPQLSRTLAPRAVEVKEPPEFYKEKATGIYAGGFFFSPFDAEKIRLFTYAWDTAQRDLRWSGYPVWCHGDKSRQCMDGIVQRRALRD